DELKKYFAEAGKRPFFGTDEYKVLAAKNGFIHMQKAPGEAFRCAPWALNSLFYLNKGKGENQFLKKNAKSTSQGTTLAQAKGWADKIGLQYQLAKRSKGAPFVSPALVHFSVGHFAAIVGSENGRYHIQDPTF